MGGEGIDVRERAEKDIREMKEISGRSKRGERKRRESRERKRVPVSIIVQSVIQSDLKRSEEGARDPDPSKLNSILIVIG